MHNPCVWFVVLVGVAVPATLPAQEPELDAPQRAAMMASVTQQSKPAAFVLQHRMDLALTERQVATLEGLTVLQRDSARVREARVFGRMQANPVNPAIVAAAGWSGPVDEAAVRDAVCQSSAAQAEFLLALARDRRAVADVLTPAQVAQLPRLQAGDVLKAIKREE